MADNSSSAEVVTPRYSGTGTTMGLTLSDYVPFEVAPVWCRETFTLGDAASDVDLGDVISNSDGLYGVCTQPASAGEQVTAIVRGCVINSSNVTLDSSASAALISQGCKIQ